MFVCLVLRSGHRALNMRPLGHSINGWSTHTHTNTHSQVWHDKILCLLRDWFPRRPPASACLPAAPSALWFLPTCVRFPKCVWISDPLFILMACYLRRLSAVITVTQQYWVTRPQTPTSRSQPDPIRPHFLSITREPPWLAALIDAECTSGLAAGPPGGHHIVCVPVMNQWDRAGRLKKLEKLLLWIMVRSGGKCFPLTQTVILAFGKISASMKAFHFFSFHFLDERFKCWSFCLKIHFGVLSCNTVFQFCQWTILLPCLFLEV